MLDDSRHIQVYLSWCSCMAHFWVDRVVLELFSLNHPGLLDVDLMLGKIVGSIADEVLQIYGQTG